MQPYPTKEEILAEDLLALETNYPEEVLSALYTWKRVWFSRRKEADNAEKLRLLAGLVRKLAFLYNHPLDNVELGPLYCYVPQTQTVVLEDDKPSIVSALHELGHHLYGNSELKACRFSVHLFKEVFPTAYARLKWDGHMLKKI